MEDAKSPRNRYQLSRGGVGERKIGDADGEDDVLESDGQAWETLNKSFEEVQSVLDQNRLLIKQVNENHRSKLPENLVQNVALIQEINCNISKVMGIYSDLSANFSNIVQQRRTSTKINGGFGTGVGAGYSNS